MIADQLLCLNIQLTQLFPLKGAPLFFGRKQDAEVAAETLGITASILKKLTLADQIIQEPLGGAHRDIKLTMSNVKYALKKELRN